MQTKKIKRARSRKARRSGTKRRVVRVKRTMKGGFLKKIGNVLSGLKPGRSGSAHIAGNPGTGSFRPFEEKNPLFNLSESKSNMVTNNFNKAMAAVNEINPNKSSTMSDIITEGKTAKYNNAKERYNAQIAEIEKRKANAQKKAQMINNTLEAARLSIAEIDSKLKNMNSKNPEIIKLMRMRDNYEAMINPIYNIVHGTRTNPSKQTLTDVSHGQMPRFKIISNNNNRITISELPPGTAPNTINPNEKAELDKRILNAWKIEEQKDKYKDKLKSMVTANNLVKTNFEGLPPELFTFIVTEKGLFIKPVEINPADLEDYGENIQEAYNKLQDLNKQGITSATVSAETTANPLYSQLRVV